MEDSYQKYVNVDGRPCRLDILDTAGQEEFKSLRANYLRNGQGYILVYSIIERASFEKSREFYEELVRTRGEKDKAVLVLVGNKYDLAESRQVSEEEGRLLAKEYNTSLFFETSAKTFYNVKEVFHEMIRQCRLVNEVCQCKGACRCRDRCQYCAKTRVHHNKDTDHRFKERTNGCGCIVL